MKIILGIMCGVSLVLFAVVTLQCAVGLAFVAVAFLFNHYVPGNGLESLFPGLFEGLFLYGRYFLMALVPAGITVRLNIVTLRALMGNEPPRLWNFALLAVADLLMFIVGIILAARGGYWSLFYVFSAFMFVKGLLCVDRAWQLWSPSTAEPPVG